MRRRIKRYLPLQHTSSLLTQAGPNKKPLISAPCGLIRLLKSANNTTALCGLCTASPCMLGTASSSGSPGCEATAVTQHPCKKDQDQPSTSAPGPAYAMENDVLPLFAAHIITTHTAWTNPKSLISAPSEAAAVMQQPRKIRPRSASASTQGLAHVMENEWQKGEMEVSFEDKGATA